MKKQWLGIGFLAAFLVPAFALAAQVQVTLANNSISPSTVNVNAGDTVVWNNVSGANQSVTADGGAFQSGTIGAGGEFAATFNQTGTYQYYDNAQGSAILGTVIVGGTSVTTPTTTTVPANYVNPNANYVSASSNANANPTLASLEAELQSLIAEINALEGNSPASNVSGSTYASGSCPQIGRVLSLGTSGSDVTSLQEFLGVTPATGYYGTQTQTAVEQWQTENNIISYGTPSTTGYGVVGPRTASAIRLACSGGSASTNNSGSGGGVVSGFLQVSPVSGEAPLSVNVVATVNTAASCTGATYTLDFGDSSQDQVIPVASGNCSQQNQSFQHTYQYGGTFTITLSSGTHSSTATVTVSGPEQSTSVTAPTDASEASGSMTAFITSGPAPLATTFYVSCAAGLAYDVVFGDGSDLGSSGVSQSSCNGGLQSVAHTYTAIGSYNAELVVFVRNAEGTVSSQNVASQGITVTGPSSSSSSSASSFSPPTLTPNVGGNPLEVQLNFTALQCGSSYNINWGDEAGALASNIDCASGASTGETANFSPTHTYAAAGTYTVTLSRETSSGTSQTDTVGVTISN